MQGAGTGRVPVESVCNIGVGGVLEGRRRGTTRVGKVAGRGVRRVPAIWGL
jgi:hypothetical protein